MAGFRFKFDAVLRHRRRQEDEHQRSLALLLREQMILHGQLREIQQTITDDKHLMSASLVGRVDVARIRQHAGHVGQVTLRAQEIALRLLGLSRKIESARAALLDATKQRKAVELLRDRQERRWLDERQRREAAELDELAIQAAGRSGRREVLR